MTTRYLADAGRVVGLLAARRLPAGRLVGGLLIEHAGSYRFGLFRYDSTTL
ncbi:hypothetical protein Drose_04840 [Dactylosporangium roseum]|uniref:Uncharacterized protein n=1 Tax=Dactylosporangium roseum TaxID=47989 RepID=A0ABY5Z6E3_9ACTN|nr:hypothetical protein [Dactylosporangium roseum]UWZ37610.1 hypothetical protein Drose_04840 [Dactylosporangium roseum]